MNLKRYRVNNIQEALQQIKKDLGPDAIIVSTRQVKEGGSAFGLFGKTMLEVTAARDEKKVPKPPESPPAARPVANSPAVAAYGLPASTPATAPHPAVHPAPKASAEDSQRLLLPIRQEIQELKDLIQSMDRKPQGHEHQAVGQLKQEVMEIRQMLQTLAVQNASPKDLDLHENLLVLFQQMTFNGLEEKFARRLVQEAEKSIPPEELQNFSYVKIFVARMLMKILKTTPGLHKEANKQKIVTLLGPTGVGKTTTTAKIASEQVLKYRRKVALFTIDTFRIGAVEQLRAYAKIMNIPLTVVGNKAELHQAMASHGDYDVLLIDTGGRSQRDEAQMYELREMFDEQTKSENILVLSATTKDAELNEITRRFGDIHLDSVIFTKLDESTTYGCIFNHCIRFKKPIAFLTTGQKVPEDIEIASKERLVDLLLNISGN